MPGLPELQRAFGGALRDEHAPTPDVIVGGQIDAASRLQIYRNNHRQSLQRALADCYPVLLRLTGEGFFAWLAHRYAQQHPPRAGNLHLFGAGLSGFLLDFEAAAGHPWLVDVARLEWAMQESYHAAGHDPLDLNALAAVAPEYQEHLRLRLHPACRLVESRWPLLRMLEVNQPDHDGDQRVDLDAGGDRILVSRPGVEVHTGALEAGVFVLLRMLADGVVLGEACEQALSTQADLDLGACIQGLVVHRVLVDLQTGD